ncbi:hypothetical protein GO495_29280 [Chitinophaga oryziterrae]|uniref:Uncharacterized protein n=1 Tax=Chitinophaga oryziterrae TaxID=1031224 RepID=A0A6N8JKL4_9BACT|nr:hypothetical protein [Chitinophaga oryziterrae]MVT44722.1 hypothetical protein [Chitinophaga oryziterrae]
MKISKFMLLGGAFTLVVGSLFATKTSKKFTAFSTAFAGTPFLGAKLIYAGHLTSATRASHTLFLITANAQATFFTSAASANKIYYK